MNNFSNVPTEILRRNLAYYESRFEAQGGRGVELADEIDAMREELDQRTITLSYLLYRQDGVSVKCATVITAIVKSSITNEEDLLAALRSAVGKWVRKTKTGRLLYECASDDMNIGDLSGVDIEEVLQFSPGIESLEISSLDIPDNWVYDTSLCEHIEEGEE